MSKKELENEIRFIKDLLDSKENELAMMENEYEDDIYHIKISINVECDDEEIKEIIETELYEKAEELRQILCDDEDFNDDEDDECELEFSLIYLEDEEKIVGVIMSGVCPYCDEEFSQIFTDGSDEIEKIVKNMGFRD